MMIADNISAPPQSDDLKALDTVMCGAQVSEKEFMRLANRMNRTLLAS